MKLRIRGDSVRLRLARGEVAQLLEAGVVEDLTRFPGGGAFHYCLSTDAGAPGIAASFAGARLTVSIPSALALAWGRSDEVGIRAVLPVGGNELAVLIEKDFPCPTGRPGEDDSDAFPVQRGDTKC